MTIDYSPPTRQTRPWVELAEPPRVPLRAWAAERMFRLAVGKVEVRAAFPDGEIVGGGGPDAPVLRVVRPEAFFRRLGAHAMIGFGEAYMAGDWTVGDDLAAVLTPLAARMGSLIPRPLQALRPLVHPAKPPTEDNTPENARANVGQHYDLSNEMFASFLDESMSYSAAWFGPGDDLHAAQLRKLDGVLDLACVGRGSRVLEIGTGWGALAVRAAQRGAHVTTLTLSEEQRELALQRVAEAGVADRVEVLLRDYRDAEGRYDAVVSVEMIEAVGEEYWPLFFSTLDSLLAPGGRVALQAITMPHDRMVASRRSYTWIHKYIFPGGQLPSIPAIEEQLRDHTSLRVGRRRALGPDYARTLHEWRERFRRTGRDVQEWGFDDTFRRLWEFYLAYSEAGFRSSYLDVWQLELYRPSG